MSFHLAGQHAQKTVRGHAIFEVMANRSRRQIDPLHTTKRPLHIGMAHSILKTRGGGQLCGRLLVITGSLFLVVYNHLAIGLDHFVTFDKPIGSDWSIVGLGLTVAR